MELDEMKQAWQLLDQRLNHLEAQPLGTAGGAGLNVVRRGLGVLMFGQSVQILVGLAFCLLFAPYWVLYTEVPHLAFYGVSLHAYGVLMIVLGIRAQLLIRRIDHAAPVLIIQRQLAALADWRLRVENPGLMLAGCLMWIPLTLVAFAQLGADLWIVAPDVVWSFVASGGVCVAIGLFALRAIARAARDGTTTGWGARLRDGTVGRRILAAQRELAAISRFERD